MLSKPTGNTGGHVTRPSPPRSHSPVHRPDCLLNGGVGVGAAAGQDQQAAGSPPATSMYAGIMSRREAAVALLVQLPLHLLQGTTLCVCLASGGNGLGPSTTYSDRPPDAPDRPWSSPHHFVCTPGSWCKRAGWLKNHTQREPQASQSISHDTTALAQGVLATAHSLTGRTGGPRSRSAGGTGWP
jgi:hypothetical protein